MTKKGLIVVGLMLLLVGLAFPQSRPPGPDSSRFECERLLRGYLGYISDLVDSTWTDETFTDYWEDYRDSIDPGYTEGDDCDEMFEHWLEHRGRHRPDPSDTTHFECRRLLMGYLGYISDLVDSTWTDETFTDYWEDYRDSVDPGYTEGDDCDEMFEHWLEHRGRHRPDPSDTTRFECRRLLMGYLGYIRDLVDSTWTDETFTDYWEDYRDSIDPGYTEGDDCDEMFEHWLEHRGRHRPDPSDTTHFECRRLLMGYLGYIRGLVDSTWTDETFTEYWEDYRESIDPDYTEGDDCDEMFEHWLEHRGRHRPDPSDPARFECRRLLIAFRTHLRAHWDTTWTAEDISNMWRRWRNSHDPDYEPGDRCDEVFNRWLRRWHSRHDPSFPHCDCRMLFMGYGRYVARFGDDTWDIDSLEHYWSDYRRLVDSSYVPGDKCDSLFARWLEILRERGEWWEDPDSSYFSDITEINKPILDIVAYPNPFNSSVSFTLSIPGETYMDAEIYDLKGNKVATIFSGNVKSSQTTISWAPENEPAGVYLIKIQTDFGIYTKTIHYSK